MYTHFYELYKRVPRARRRVLANFIHELKKLSGRGFRSHVTESISQSENDFVSVNISNLGVLSKPLYLALFYLLVDECLIPRGNVDETEDTITIRLYTDY